MSNFKMLRVGTIGTLNLWIARHDSYGTLDLDNTVHLYNPSQSDMDYAIDNADRLNTDNIVYYELSDSEFLNRQAYYTERR